MRASAILLESMVLSLSMSSGRTMPATINSRTSKLTRTSCLPSITRLPLGSTCVTTPATLVESSSLRSTEPLPSVEPVESAVKMRVGTGVFMIGTLGLPKKFAIPESSAALRLRAVSFSSEALSVIFTLTVRMSPIWLARWSLKKAREPVRQSELG